MHRVSRVKSFYNTCMKNSSSSHCPIPPSFLTTQRKPLSTFRRLFQTFSSLSVSNMLILLLLDFSVALAIGFSVWKMTVFDTLSNPTTYTYKYGCIYICIYMISNWSFLQRILTDTVGHQSHVIQIFWWYYSIILYSQSCCLEVQYYLSPDPPI